MTQYKAPLDDILFSLTKVAGATDLPEWDEELSSEVLGHFVSFAEGELAPIDEGGDMQGCRLENGSVKMPDGFPEAFRAYAEQGWYGLATPEEFGGQGLDEITAGCVYEIFAGANMALLQVIGLGPSSTKTIISHGTDEQKERYVPMVAAGDAVSTMCITEPGAGSDLSGLRTKAVKTDDGWKITGEKIFITAGDHDLSDEILHLVLARTGSREDGVKGLSLFLCTKSEAGKSIQVSRIEEKLGLHASPTCTMVFDEAPGELLGKEGAGLATMFTMMNDARIDVALQGVAQATRAHAIADDYARERKQGKKRDGTEAFLIDHADVQRMLDEQRSLSLGARSVAHIALVELERGERMDLVDFLTPLCKIFCTEAGIRSADLGIQVLGGYGYVTEYRVSQCWRDARITSIYEGANGIHALQTATRGLKVKGGAGADAFDTLIGDLSDHPEILALRDTWRQARTATLGAEDPTKLAYQFTQLTCELFFRAVWGRIASVSSDPEMSRLFDIVLDRPLPVSLSCFERT